MLNPFIKQIEALQVELRDSGDQLQQLTSQLRWFQGFDVQREIQKLEHAERLEAEANDGLRVAQEAMRAIAAQIKRYEQEASIWNPLRWFSAERALANSLLAQAKLTWADRNAKVESVIAAKARATEHARKIRSDIATARAFDSALAQSTITTLRETQDRIGPELANLHQRSKDFDDALAGPLRYQSERYDKLARLRHKISRAEFFSAALASASTSYERAMIHERCSRELQDSKPLKVLQQCRKQRDYTENDLNKINARINHLIKVMTRDIRHIVIDGSNLSHKGNRFIGLSPLRAILPLLSSKYQITLIFDASICHHLRISRTKLHGYFPEVSVVHTVQSKRDADETILAVAGDDPCCFVLSNDRFKDYPETLAAQDCRLIQHEIIDRFIHIHDLRLKAEFSLEQTVASTSSN